MMNHEMHHTAKTQNELGSDDLAQTTFSGRGVSPFPRDIRAEEIRAGLLVDVSETARSRGFACSAALTKNLWNTIARVSETLQQDGVGAYLPAVLGAARQMLPQAQSGLEEIFFEMTFTSAEQESMPHLIRLHCEPGDSGEPVITLSDPDTDPHFALGLVLITPGAVDALLEEAASPAPLLARHKHGDWGELDEFDRGQNDYAVYSDAKILSAYTLPNTRKLIWIITEADRSATTVLLPSEY